MSVYRSVVSDEIVDDVRVVMLSETVFLVDSEYVSYVVSLFGYDHRKKDFSDLIDEFSFVELEDAENKFNEYVNGWSG